jgi:hypothetical protein
MMFNIFDAMSSVRFPQSAVLVGGFLVLVAALNATVDADCHNICGKHNSSNITGPRWPEELKREEGMYVLYFHRRTKQFSFYLV